MYLKETYGTIDFRFVDDKHTVSRKWTVVRTTLNLFLHRQKTKLDRYVQSSLWTYLRRLFGKRNPKQCAPQSWPADPAFQKVVIKRIPLPSYVPVVSLEG